MTDFEGDGYRELVDFVVQRFADIRDGKAVPRVLVLEAESGAGKSRVIREFYDRLRLDPTYQPLNDAGEGYWPALDDPANAPLERALHQRKVLGPPVRGFTRPPGTFPGFFWLPIACQTSSQEEPIPALELIAPDIDAHVRYVAAAWRKSASTADQFHAWWVKASRKELRSIASEGGLEAFSLVLSALDVGLPGLGLITSRVTRAARVLKDRLETRKRIERGGELDEVETGTVELARDLLALAAPAVPLILVVEDAHLMDQELAVLLQSLAAPMPGNPVFAIATAWPEGRVRPTYSEWLGSLKEDSEGCLVEIVGSGQPQEFPTLPLADRIDLVRQFAPKTDEATLALVAERWHTPLSIVMTMTGQRIQMVLDQGELKADEEDLAAMPDRLPDIYRERWNQLDMDTQEVLMLAAWSIVNEQSDGTVNSFFAAIVELLSARIPEVGRPKNVMAALSRSRSPYEWTTSPDVDIDILQFREWILQHIAWEKCGAFLPSRLQASLNEDLIGHASAWFRHRAGDGYVIEDYSHADVRVMARWLLSREHGTPQPPAEVLSMAAITLAYVEADAHRYGAALDRVWEPDRLAALPASHDDVLTLRLDIARWTAETGRVYAAVDQLRDLLADPEVVWDDHPRTRLVVLNNLAVAVGDLGDETESLRLERTVLLERTRLFGETDPETLISQSNLAYSLADAGQFDEAFDLYDRVLKHRTDILGADDAETLSTRAIRAGWLARSGRDAAGGLKILRDVVQQQEALFGPDDLETLLTLHNIAFLECEAGEYSDSIRDFAKALQGRIQVLGADSPTTLTTRHGLAYALGKSGDPIAAAAEFRLLLADRIRVEGESHPDTRATREELISWLEVSGQRAEADRERAEGLDQGEVD